MTAGTDGSASWPRIAGWYDQLLRRGSGPPMIEAARRHESAEPLGIRYLVDDAQSLTAVRAGSFDIVTCQLGLTDIPDLTLALTAADQPVYSAVPIFFAARAVRR